MKHNYEIILDEMDMTLRDLQEQASEMKAMLQSELTSLAQLGSSKPKLQVNQVALTSLVGRKKLRLKQLIMRKQEALTEKQCCQQSSSKLEASRWKIRT
jgi:hypothetical protein